MRAHHRSCRTRRRVRGGSAVAKRRSKRLAASQRQPTPPQQVHPPTPQEVPPTPQQVQPTLPQQVQPTLPQQVPPTPQQQQLPATPHPTATPSRSTPRRTPQRVVVTATPARTPNTPNRGQYGCVYWPSLKLNRAGVVRTDDSVEAEGFVSKLQYDSAAARAEVHIGEIVAPLLSAPAKKRKRTTSSSSSSAASSAPPPRFAPTVEAQALTRAQVPDKILRKCAILDKNAPLPPGVNGEDLLLTKMPSAGKLTLDKHLREVGATHMQLSHMWEELGVSLDLLATVGVVHRDLKGDNIIHDGNVLQYTPTIIDFGLSMHTPPLLDESVSSEVSARRWREAFPSIVTDYQVWCPEIALCGALWQLSPLYYGDNLASTDSSSSDSSDSSSDGSSSDDGSNSSSSESSLTDELYWRYYAVDGQPLPPDEVIDARTVRRLRGVIAACFLKNPLLQSLAVHRPAEIAAKRRRLFAMADACLGQTRIAAARRVLSETWRSWDRFSIAGAFLRHRPATEEEMVDYTEEYQNDLALFGKKGADDFKKQLRHTRAFWAEVESYVLA